MNNKLWTINYSKYKTIIAIVSVFVVSFLVLFLSMDRTINIYDEGIMLTGAIRITAGDIPHRDFYANYGPAEFYLLSWLFDVFGQRIVVERIFDLVVRAGIITIVYASLILYCRQTIVIFVIVICALWLCTVGNHGYPIYSVLLLTIGSSMMVLKILTRSTSISYQLIAGLLTGLSALFRYDVGFFAFIAHILSVSIITLQTKYYQNNKIRCILHNFFPYIIATGFPVVAVLIWYWFNEALYPFIHDVILFPSEYYNRTRSLPFPGFYNITHTKNGVIYLPIVIICTVMLLFFIENIKLFKTYYKLSIREVFARNNGVEFLMVFSLLTAIFYMKGLVRVSVEHMQLALIPSLMVIALLMEIAISNTKWFRAIIVIVATISFVTALTSGYEKIIDRKDLVLSDFSGFYKLISNLKVDVESDGSSTIQRKSAFFVSRDRDAAISFIVRNTAPDERIFIGLTRHDKVFINDVSSYFQTNRLPATKWHHFDPGLQSSVEIQSKIIDDLEQNKPRYIWLESTWDKVNEPNESANSSGITILDEYIRRKYKLAQNFGRILVWKRSFE